MCQLIVLIGICVVCISAMLTSQPNESYLQLRDRILAEEDASFTGSNIILSQNESEVDKILLSLKLEELERGYKNSSEFLASLHFFHSRDRILKSKVFDFIRKLPKGGSLHTHLLAGVNAEFIVKNFTYRENLYGGYVNNVFKLKFLLHPDQDQITNWTLIKEMRESYGAAVFDEWLKNQLTLTEDMTTAPAEVVWAKFKKIFTTLYDMISYKPIFEEYIFQLLRELNDDNVFYTELKGTIMQLYDLNGTAYTKQDFFQVFIDTVQQFQKKYPHFIGVGYILSIYRGVDNETLQTGLDEIIEMKKLFPDFITGFDFVGYEEEGNTLLYYSPQLLNVQDLKFFFHAGETNWFGHTDLNLLDAILLNSTRIGHGFALTKHPKMLQMAKNLNIALEICPISNQVLKLINDPRNHPAAALLALDYPVVVCNDDPLVWNASGLSFDWYILFMAMTPENGGLQILKQLAINSITYSSMPEEQRLIAMTWWQKSWQDFIDDVLKCIK